MTSREVSLPFVMLIGGVSVEAKLANSQASSCREPSEVGLWLLKRLPSQTVGGSDPLLVFLAFPLVLSFSVAAARAYKSTLRLLTQRMLGLPCVCSSVCSRAKSAVKF